MATRQVLVSAVLLFALTACGGKPSNSVSATGAKKKSSPGQSSPATSGNARELIIGKWVIATGQMPRIEWESIGGKPQKGETLQFAKNGDLKLVPPINPNAKLKDTFVIEARKYKFVSDDGIEVKPVGGLGAAAGAGDKMIKTVKVKVTAEELTLTDDKGNSDKYQRSK